MEPLCGAYEQVNGALEHLDALRPEIKVFTKTIADDVTLNYKMGNINIKGHQLNVPIGTAVLPINKPTPPKVSRLIGETIQSLRKALDYLVYELACFDYKSDVEQTQFVIVDSENDFKKNQWHLKGLLGEHIAMFEKLQPYKGCSWTKLLRDISNPDKHKYLTAVRHPVALQINSNNTQANLAGRQVEKDSYAHIQITFSDGTPVMECLESLVKNVTCTLDIFKPEFR